MGSYNKRISDQSKVRFNPINRELEDSENSELDSRVDILEETVGDSSSGLVKSVDDINSELLEINDNLSAINHNGAKNLLPMTVDVIKALNTNGTWNNNNYSRYNTNFEILTNSDGNVIGIKVTGTPNNEVALILNFTGIANTEYIINGCPSGGGSSMYRIDTFGGGVTNTPDYGSGATFTASGNSQYVRVLISNGYSIPTGGLIFLPMIRLSTDSDSTFEPYAMTNLELTNKVANLESRVYALEHPTP